MSGLFLNSSVYSVLCTLMILSPYSDYVDSANLLLPTVSAMSIMELVSIYPSHLGRGREAVATVIPYYTLKPSLYSTITPPPTRTGGRLVDRRRGKEQYQHIQRDSLELSHNMTMDNKAGHGQSRFEPSNSKHLRVRRIANQE